MAVRENIIYIGSKTEPTLTLTNESIVSVNGNLACNLIGEELSVDTLEITFHYTGENVLFCPSDDGTGMMSVDGEILYCLDGDRSTVTGLGYTTPLWYYNAGNYVGKFYLKNVKRTAKDEYVITAESVMGMLETHTFYGALYNAKPIGEVIEQILLTDGLQDVTTPFMTELAASISYGPDVEDYPAYGWIPSGTKREALYQVLFAYNLNLIKADDDTILITWLYDSDPETIDDNSVYNDGDITYEEPAERVEVTEHSYIYYVDTERVTLYDNTEDGIDVTKVVVFDNAPIYPNSLQTTGTVKITAKCENAAIVSGVGTLTGIPYTHNTSVISRGAETATDGTTITVTDADMICLNNSDAVADKLWAYYTARKESSQSIVLNGERCGVKYQYKDPFGDTSTAYITSMSIDASSIIKANCTMVSNYTPTGNLGAYTHSAVIVGSSGTWTVPESVFEKPNPRIRVTLIGGGTGGSSGYAGEDGKEHTAGVVDTNVNEGGAAGEGGEGGKILTVTLEGDDLLSSYEYSCGAYGEGGTYSISHDVSNPGAEGTATTFGAYSSDDGTRVEKGVKNFFNAETYGAAGYSCGYAGGNSGYKVAEGSNTYLMYDGDDVYVYEYFYDSSKGTYIFVNESGYGGMTGGFTQFYYDGGTYWYYCGATGGDGGGAAVNGNGGDGGDPSWYNVGYTILTGNGGNGAKPGYTPAMAKYGCGGIGGAGGGAGGDAGVLNNNGVSQYVNAVSGTPGYGGFGGPGGPGGVGCILIYY